MTTAAFACRHTHTYTNAERAYNVLGVGTTDAEIGESTCVYVCVWCAQCHPAFGNNRARGASACR